MAAPVDSARQTSQTTTAGTSHTINVGSPVAGTLLIVAITFGGATGTITFTGYTQIASDESAAGNSKLNIYWRWADGTEGVSDSMTTGTGVKMGAIAWEITGAANETPTVSTVVTGTTSANTAQSGSVAPTSPPQDTLYLSIAGGDGEVGAYTAAPTNYANLTAANSSTGGAASTNIIMGGASRQITSSSSDDPSTFTHGAHNAGWQAFTVAMREPAAAVNMPPGPPILLPDARTMQQVYLSRSR